MLKNKFSWSKYREQRMESLSFFGRNRFQDWVIVLSIVSVLVVVVLGYGVATYLVVAYDLDNKEANQDVSFDAEVQKELTETKKRIERAFTSSEKISATSSLLIDPSR